MIYDVIVVGNSILGYTTAYNLINQDPSIKVAIIGPRNRIGSASVSAGAMLNAYAEVTNRTFSSLAGKKKFEMALKASKLWPMWVNQLNEQLSFDQKLKIQDGTVVILNARSGKLDCENYEAIVNTLNFYQEGYEEINPKDISGFNPFEDSRPLCSIHIPKEGSINSLEVINALEIILSSNSHVTFIDDFAKKIIHTNGKITGIETEKNDVLSASQVVLANGAYAQKLIDDLPEIRDNIPRILAGIGYSLLLKQNSSTSINHVIRTPNRSGACGLHALPRDKTTLYVGASNNVYFEPRITPTAGLIYFLFQCAIEQINQDLYNSHLLGWQVGNRPATIDTFPLIGETSIKGLWLLTGTYRDGFHQSPLLGEHLANQVLGKRGLIDDIFLPERPLIQTLTVAESINEYILHYMAASYEHGSRPAKFILEKGYSLPVRYKAEKLYEKLDTNFGLSPDMVFMFDFDASLEQRVAYFKKYFSRTKHRTLGSIGTETANSFHFQENNNQRILKAS
ncbi:MAG: hypothetical protein K0R76_146 [Alphaproteobacteria bacterium]|jgi:glycine/D-amino acid oxidase-like deaminating enzyme|nr:hypothetical protein [Alphaproteobacteria bacterium]